MNRIILADSQAVFRAGIAKVLAMDDDLRIVAQCSDVERMMHSITTYPGAVVLFASSLQPNLGNPATPAWIVLRASLRVWVLSDIVPISGVTFVIWPVPVR